MALSTFAWSYASYYIRAVLNHLSGVEGSFSAGKALYDYFRIFIN
ncbi:hypothetical protein MARINOS108_50091 [Marinoscillum sp. 108]|nr:hypothetical protein MARINOS108_50091 [Marinoscillum sp. 108]